MNEDIFIIVFAVYALVFAILAFFRLVVVIPMPSSIFPYRIQIFRFDLPSVSELLLWAEELGVSLEQLKATYEWQIDQWSSFSKAVLTATLAFVSAVVIAVLKQEIEFTKINGILIVLAGILVSTAIYLFAQRTISRLRQEFLALLNILSLLK